MSKIFLISVIFCFSALFLPVFSQTEESQSLADEGETVFLSDSLRENVKENKVSEEITLISQDNLKETFNVKPDASSFIFKKDYRRSWSTSLYQDKDEKILSYEKTRALISTIPENNKLMRQERVWRVLSKVFAGLSYASLGAVIYYYYDYDGSSRAYDRYLYSWTGVFTFSVYSLFSQAYANNKLQQGVDNYNYNIVKQQ
jgi:hypothetical protein